MSRLQFYSYFRSSASFRVRIALHLKGIPHDYHAVHLLKDGGEQNQHAYRNVNPMGEVPSIVDGDFVLSQSMAILQYLDEKYPKPRLFPADLKSRCKVIQMCENINAGIQPLQNLKVFHELERRYGVDQAGKENWAQLWISKGFDGIEKSLEATAGTYAFGGEVSAADLYIVPQWFTSKRLNVDLSPYPIINRVTENCMKLEAFAKAEPSAQPDTPPELKK